MAMIQPIAESFRLTHFIMNLVAADISPADAIRRSRGEEGASIAWIIGHLCHYRHLTMNLLGAGVESPYAELFGDASASDGSAYPAIGNLLRGWNEAHEELERVLADVSDEQILAPVGGDGGPHGEKAVLDNLVFYMWHESYHMGQLGTIRKQLDYPATAELVMAGAGATADEAEAGDSA